MMISKKIEKSLTVGLLIAAMIFTFGTFAKANVAIDDTNGDEDFKFEDADLVSFVEANREISQLRREYNEEIAETVEEMGMTMERFNQIARAAEIGALESGNFSSDEIETFNNAAPVVTEMRREMQNMTQAVLFEKNLSSELYREILSDYRSDQELQEYVRELLRERAREEAFQKRKKEIMEEQGLTEEEAEELIIRRRDADEEEEE